MFAKYSYNAGATMANILLDMSAILTGQTNPNLLSAACNVANTEIFTTYSTSGWTLHDAAASANSIAFTAPNADGFGSKYALFDISSSNFLRLRIVESWNATTHTATNVISLDNTFYDVRLNTATGGIIYLSASARRIVLGSSFASTFGASAGGWAALFERPRTMGFWDTTGNNYPLSICACPNSGLSSNSTGGVFPRVRSRTTNTDATGQQAFVGIIGKQTDTSMTNSSVPIVKIVDENGTPSNVILQFWFQSTPANAGTVTAEVSTLNDCYILQPNYGAYADELLFNGKTYFIITNASASNTNGSLLVPKG